MSHGITAFADRLRAAGHDVHTPDLFDGRTLGSIEAGMAYFGALGFDEIMERGTRAADGSLAGGRLPEFYLVPLWVDDPGELPVL